MHPAEQLILENLKTKNPYLDLGYCGLDGTEPELQLLEQCTHLETLIFSEWWYDVNAEKIGVTKYESQNIGEPNYLAHLPSCLPQSLRKLVLVNNKILDISGVGNLTALTYLEVGGNQISDISAVRRLSALTYLNLNHNQISDISVVENLKALTILFIANNQLSDISAVKNLNRLTILDLRGNQISDISVVEKLKELTELYLFDNQISDISVVGKLKELMYLYLENNQIKYLPPTIVFADKLQELRLADNPIENIPQEYFDKKESWGGAANVLAEVRDYFQSIANKDETRELNEAKLVIAGVGEVGKSELVEALSTEGYTFVAGRNSTQGIQIRQWQQSCTREGKDFVFCTNIWDLAGQNENYHTHQFFLSKNTVYLFVWNARVNNNEANQFEYWLQAISLLSEKSPILVVQNKIDENRNAETNQENWKEKFPHIVGFYKTSCKTGEGISELRQAIQTALLALPATRELWNKHRFAVREALEKETRDYIYTEEYHRICSAHSLRKDEANFLASQLHDIGVMLHYPHNESLRNVVVLKSDWAVVAAYCLIHKEKVQAGRFHNRDLPTIWDSARFEYNRPYLLELMKHFELIFQLQESETYIVPEGLPTEEPQNPNPSHLSPLISQPFLRFEYHYEFMPKGILSRLICRVHTYIKGEQFWRYGVELEDKEGNQARIVLNDVSRILKVEVWGDSPSLLLYLIRSHTEAIHQNLKNPPLQEKVPCVCGECRQAEKPYLHNYATLKNFQAKGRKTRECEKSAEDVEIALLLQGILDTQQRQAKPLLDLIDRANVAGFFMEIERLGVSGVQIATLRKEFIHNGDSFQYADRLKVWVMDYFAQKI